MWTCQHFLDNRGHAHIFQMQDGLHISPTVTLLTSQGILESHIETKKTILFVAQNYLETKKKRSNIVAITKMERHGVRYNFCRTTLGHKFCCTNPLVKISPLEIYEACIQLQDTVI